MTTMETPGLQLLFESATVSERKLKVFDMLESTHLLSRFDGGDVRQLVEFVAPYHAEPGSVLFSEGDPGSWMGILVAGRLEVLKKDCDNRQQKIAEISPGKSFGEMSLIDGLPYSATIQAAGPCDFIRFAKQDFLLCTQKYPTMGIKLLTEIARLISLRLRHTSGLLVDVLSSET